MIQRKAVKLYQEIQLQDRVVDVAVLVVAPDLVVEGSVDLAEVTLVPKQLRYRQSQCHPHTSHRLLREIRNETLHIHGESNLSLH